MWIIRQKPKQKHICTSTAAVDVFGCDNVTTEMSSIDCYIVLINLKSAFLKFVNWKYSVAMEISVPHSDMISNLGNISHDVRHLKFVDSIFG